MTIASLGRLLTTGGAIQQRTSFNELFPQHTVMVWKRPVCWASGRLTVLMLWLVTSTKQTAGLEAASLDGRKARTF